MGDNFNNGMGEIFNSGMGEIFNNVTIIHIKIVTTVMFFI